MQVVRQGIEGECGMTTRQQHADAALQHWQDLRARFPNPEERIEQLMIDFFRHPVASAVEYDATLRRVTEEMEDTNV
jgi:hypothetical protein